MIELDNSCPPQHLSTRRAFCWSRVEGDRELLREIVELFAADSPQLLAELRQGCAEGDAEILKRAAHTLKGAASNFGAAAVMAAARDLETMGLEGNLTGACAGIERLEESVRALEDALGKFSERGCKPPARSARGLHPRSPLRPLAAPGRCYCLRNRTSWTRPHVPAPPAAGWQRGTTHIPGRDRQD